MTARGSRGRLARTGLIALCTAAGCGSVAAGTAAAGGGLAPPDPPEVSDVTCVEGCLDVRTVAETGRIEVSGSELGSSEKVRFRGAEKKISVTARKVKDTSLVAKVPEGAVDGKVTVVDSSGVKSPSPVKIEIAPASRVEDIGSFAVTKAEASPPKSFFDGDDKSALEYMFEADAPVDIRIDVLSKKTGAVVDSVVKRDQEPFTVNKARWNGLVDGKRIAPNGKYRFEVSPVTGGSGKRAGFSYFDHIFPVRGAHTYGDGIGAGRGHQGQDIFAACGKKIVAARGGRVQTNAYQSSAGYYVVIDGRKTGIDYAYMHLERRDRPKEGSRVRTGEVIGYNSDTGNASGCHLHFEMWSAPGWYEGGSPISPTRRMKKWDDWS